MEDEGSRGDGLAGTRGALDEAEGLLQHTLDGVQLRVERGGQTGQEGLIAHRVPLITSDKHHPYHPSTLCNSPCPPH